jgi:hypothetical protein
MYKVDVYLGNNVKSAKIKPLTAKRDWMQTLAYNCYPMTSANLLGFYIYFEEDVSFIWDGDNYTPAKPTNGSDNVWVGRPFGTVSFETNLVFTSDSDTSILIGPPPNHFIEGANVISSLVSSSFFTGALPIVWKLHIPNKEYFIPAGTPIASVLPLSLSQVNNSEINFTGEVYDGYRLHNDSEYIDWIHNYYNENEVWPKVYEKGKDHKGNKIGEHEVQRLNLNVKYGKKENKDGRG